MQQSSATPKNKDVGIGLRKIVACSHFSSQCLLVPTVFGTVSSLHPTSFLMIFTLVSLIFLSRLSLDCSQVWAPVQDFRANSQPMEFSLEPKLQRASIRTHTRRAHSRMRARGEMICSTRTTFSVQLRANYGSSDVYVQSR